METQGGSNPKISAEEAAASLAAVEDSRRKARRADYPVWFRVATGMAMSGAAVYIMVPLSQPVKSLLPMAVLLPAIAAMVVAVILHAAGIWADPISGLITSGVVFVVWVATGLAFSARPIRR